MVAVGVSEGIKVVVEDGEGEGGRVGERVAGIPTDGEGLLIGTACSSATLPQLVMIIDSNKAYFALVIHILISFSAYTGFGFDLLKMRKKFWFVRCCYA